MISLLIDTATSNLTVSIIKEQDILYKYQENILSDMSSKLLPIIDSGLKDLNLKLNNIDKIFVVNGPGSFTGIRVGVTVAKTIAWTLKKDIIPLSSLELMATTNTDKKYLVPQNMCIGGRKKTETINDGSIECSKTLENQMLSLPQVNEYLLASIDPNCSKITDSQCSNYNYFTRINTEFWSITIDADTTSKVYRMSPIPYLTDAANTSRIKVVVHINSKVRYVSGDGTKEKPYIIG